MAKKTRVASLNLRAYPNRGSDHVYRLARIVAAARPDVVLMQECRRAWVAIVCEAAGLEGVHSHEVEPCLPAGRLPPDGTAIAVRPPIEVGRSWRIAPNAFHPAAVNEHIPEPVPEELEAMPERLADRFSARSLLCELDVRGSRVVAGSFHATPGTSTVAGRLVHERKPFFHGAVAVELTDVNEPYVFGIDANEPRSETPTDVLFHWADDRSGSRKMHALLGREPMHRGRDVFREWFASTGIEPASPDCLIATYAPTERFQRRFDSLWATEQFVLAGPVVTMLDEAIDAGGDHALVFADLRLG